MARCENCSKFVSLDDGDPDVNIDDPEIADGVVTITGNVHIVRTCADCGQDLRSADFDVNLTEEIPEHTCKKEETVQEMCQGCDDKQYLTYNYVEGQAVGQEHIPHPIAPVALPESDKPLEESIVPSPEDDEPQFECSLGEAEMVSKTEGKGRGMKTFYGFQIDYTVNCTKCEEKVLDGYIEEYIQASHMDEC